MNLRILLPSCKFFEKKDVSRIVAETNLGSVGFMVHRLDCIAALVPGILFYQSKSEGESFVAVDGGTLIKTGLNVVISVRRAIEGADLEHLKKSVEEEFKTLDEQERDIRSSIAKIESRFLQGVVEMRNE